MEESNYILFAGGDALEYWSKPMHKKCSMTSIWGCLFGMCGSYDQFFDSPHIPDCAHMYAFRKHRLLRMQSHQFETPSPVLTLLVCHSFFMLFYLRNSKVYDSL